MKIAKIPFGVNFHVNCHLLLKANKQILYFKGDLVFLSVCLCKGSFQWREFRRNYATL